MAEKNQKDTAISLATVVIEAPEKSGALITADFALEQGREIFVIPGDIDRKNSIGALRLLQKGAAHPVSSGQEIIEHLKLFTNKKSVEPTSPVKYNLSDNQLTILSCLSKFRGRSIGQISVKSTLETSQILSSISILEIKGLIQSKDGAYYRLF